jgi:ParB-like chromosome segregation protein Spo0J
MTPVIVKKVDDDPNFDYELVEGERRLTAAGMACIEYMLAEVRKIKNAEDQFTSSVVANFGRLGHTPLETAQAIQRIRTFKIMENLSPGQQVKKLSRIFARSEPWVYQHLAILRLHPEVQKMMGPETPQEERLSHSVGIFVSQLHPDLQLNIAKKVVEQKMNINQARVYARQAADDVGAQAGTAKRRGPSSDYNLLLSFMGRIDEGLKSLNTPTIMDQIRKRKPEDLAIAAKQLEEQARDLQRLSRAILQPPRQETSSGPARTSFPSTQSVSREMAAGRVADIGNHLNGKSGNGGAQTLKMSTLILRTLFYHQENPHVNLSRSRLMNLITTDHGPETAVKQALEHAKAHWRKPLEAEDLGEEEKKFIRFLHKFRREYGSGAHLEDVLSFARNQDTNTKNDPVSLSIS